jgi:hypothetical protein
LGAESRERVIAARGEPTRMVKRCEEIYEKVLRERDGERAEEAASDSGAGLEEYRLRLLERERALNAREADLKRLEARHRASFPVRLDRALRWRWRLLTGKSFLGYPE